MIYLGIDPGQKGGISYIHNRYVKSVAYSDDNLKSIMQEIKNAQDDCICVIEKVGAMPGQGVKSMFSFGKSFGYILGVIEANSMPYQLIPPQTWKKEFSLIGKTKSESIKVCKHLYPETNLLASIRSHKESDGMAESLLLATYGKRKL